MTGQKFINDILPALNLDLNKTFCISSYVPDGELRENIIPDAFLYYRTVYASNFGLDIDEVIENLPIF